MRKDIKFIEQNGDILLRISFANQLFKKELKLNFYNESVYLKYPQLFKQYQNKWVVSLNQICKTFNLNKEELQNKIKFNQSKEVGS